jgi:hypothetical protein
MIVGTAWKWIVSEPGLLEALRLHQGMHQGAGREPGRLLLTFVGVNCSQLYGSGVDESGGGFVFCFSGLSKVSRSCTKDNIEYYGAMDG